MKFNISDLDRSILLPRAKAEAEEIHSGNGARGRSLEEVMEASLYGHAAEVYLIQEHNFSDDPRPYKDLFNPEGDPVEIKVTGSYSTVPHVIRRLNDAKVQKWRNFPDIAYIFVGKKATGDYILEGQYKWTNNKKYVKQK